MSGPPVELRNAQLELRRKLEEMGIRGATVVARSDCLVVTLPRGSGPRPSIEEYNGWSIRWERES